MPLTPYTVDRLEKRARAIADPHMRLHALCKVTQARAASVNNTSRETKMRKPKGHSGSWFAEWEAESLPCIHQRHLHGTRYIDPGMDDNPKWNRFIAELRKKKKVIVTTSFPPGDDGIYRRKSYVGVWEIGDVRIDVEERKMIFDLEALIYRF